MDFNSLLAVLLAIVVLAVIVVLARQRKVNVEAKVPGAEFRLSGEDQPPAPAPTPADAGASVASTVPVAGPVTATITGSPGAQQAVGSGNTQSQSGNVNLSSRGDTSVGDIGTGARPDAR